MKKNFLMVTVLMLSMVFMIVSCDQVITDSGSDDNNTDNKSSTKDITAFGFTTPEVTGEIDGLNITATVPHGTDVTELVATFTTTGESVKVGETAQVSGTTVNDFTSPVTYVATAEDGSTKSYVVTVSVAISKKITSIRYVQSDDEVLGNDSFLYDGENTNLISKYQNKDMSYTLWLYNDDGLVIEKKIYDNNDTLLRTREILYENGKVSRIDYKDASGDLTQYFKNIYTDGILTKLESLGNDDVWDSHFEFDYNDNKRIKVSWFRDGLQQYSTYEYANEKISKISFFRGDNDELLSYMTTEFDSHGNLIKLFIYNAADIFQGTYFITYSYGDNPYNAEIINESLRMSGWPVWY